MNNQLVTIPVPGTSNPIMAVQKDGTEWVAARHICDSLGIDWKSQHRKLESKAWARVVMMTTHDSSGRKQEISMVDRRTLTMWLATIDTNRVSEEARPTLEAYQLEAANALDSYFHKGGVINPRATEHQRKALLFDLHSQMELCQAAKGLVHDKFLEAKARIILARGMGETPELDPATKPLYVQQFLKEKGLSRKQLASKASGFGRRLKRIWTQENGVEPQKAPIELGNGRIIEAYAYTEADRGLMQQVWDQYYAA